MIKRRIQIICRWSVVWLLGYRGRICFEAYSTNGLKRTPPSLFVGQRSEYKVWRFSGQSGEIWPKANRWGSACECLHTHVNVSTRMSMSTHACQCLHTHVNVYTRMSISTQSLLTSRQTEEEVGRQPSWNGQAWSSPSSRGQWRTEKKWRKLVVKSSVVPQRPSRLRDRWKKVKVKTAILVFAFRTIFSCFLLFLLFLSPPPPSPFRRFH